jgi:hypothetical protein
VTQLLGRWHGHTWTALVTREPYGLHFSVGALGRPPSDAEIDEARDAYAGILPSVEITDWWQRNGRINPWVRHYASTPHPAVREAPD